VTSTVQPDIAPSDEPGGEAEAAPQTTEQGDPITELDCGRRNC
jgi:hypothetical protein